MGCESPQLPAQQRAKDPLRFLGYALPRAERDQAFRTHDFDGLELHDVPLGSGVSFLDYDGVVMFAGVYERLSDSGPLFHERRMVCTAIADLHQREREFFTALEMGKTFVFLTPSLPERIGYYDVEPSCDLFRSLMSKMRISWRCCKDPCPIVESIVPEFRDYVSRYGTGYVHFEYSRDQENWIRPLCRSEGDLFGLVVGGRVFVLPATIPQTVSQAIQMTRPAVTAAVAYRARMSEELPQWVEEFQFKREVDLHKRLDALQQEQVTLQSEIDTFTAFKGVLAYRSDPLVEAVSKIIEQFFDIKLTIDDQCIEDATLKDEQGGTVAVFEVKGVNGNFTRQNVNQVDSHRERLGLPSTTPGVLIMNTINCAASLAEKDKAPHPDIIGKAVADNVLLIRTLDLLRYADAVQQGSLSKERFRDIILGGPGWLRVVDQVATVVKE